MTIDKVLITRRICFTLYLIFTWYLLNNKFVTPAMYVNKFKGVIIA